MLYSWYMFATFLLYFRYMRSTSRECATRRDPWDPCLHCPTMPWAASLQKERERCSSLKWGRANVFRSAKPIRIQPINHILMKIMYKQKFQIGPKSKFRLFFAYYYAYRLPTAIIAYYCQLAIPHSLLAIPYWIFCIFA